MARDDKADAACLRAAAEVLRARARKQTLGMSVVIRTLERAADRIDKADIWHAASGRG